MGTSWDTDTNFTETIETSFGSGAMGMGCPSMVRGALYRGPLNDTKLYTFGGSTFLANQSAADWKQPLDNTYSVWSFDIDTSIWNEYDITSQVPLRPDWGGWTERASKGFAYSLNGQIDRGSNNFEYDKIQTVGGVEVSTGNLTTYLGGLVVFNLNNHTAWNRSSEPLG